MGAGLFLPALSLCRRAEPFAGRCWGSRRGNDGLLGLGGVGLFLLGGAISLGCRGSRASDAAKSFLLKLRPSPLANEHMRAVGAREYAASLKTRVGYMNQQRLYYWIDAGFKDESIRVEIGNRAQFERSVGLGGVQLDFKRALILRETQKYFA